MTKLKFLIATLGGTIAMHFKAYLPLFIIVCIAMAFDFITGISAAIITKSGLNSKVARSGAIKKGILFLTLIFGVFLDFLIPMATKQLGIDFGINLLFSSIIGFYIAFTECVSVCENIFKCCPNAFPKWIIKILTDGKEHLDNLGGGDFVDSSDQ